MWPFPKKKASISTTPPFQEFLRTYVPPAPIPVENPVNVDTVCPLCAYIHPAGSIPSGYPVCPDCSSEAIDVEVQPLRDYLVSQSLEKFDEMLARWEAAEGFLPEYKKLKSERIQQLKALKLNER